jgi:hypothetical protein
MGGNAPFQGHVYAAGPDYFSRSSFEAPTYNLVTPSLGQPGSLARGEQLEGCIDVREKGTCLQLAMCDARYECCCCNTGRLIRVFEGFTSPVTFHLMDPYTCNN